MSHSHKDLESKHLQCEFNTEGGITYYVNGYPACLYFTREDEARYCANKAGGGTEHEGEGRCCYHGGQNTLRTDLMKKGGLYSVVAKGRLKEKLDLLEGQDLLDLNGELEIQKGLLANAVENYSESEEASDAAAVLAISNSIVSTVGKIQQIQSQQTLTAASARLMMIRAVEVQKRLLEKWFPEDYQDRLNEFLIVWRTEVEGTLGFRNTE